MSLTVYVIAYQGDGPPVIRVYEDQVKAINALADVMTELTEEWTLHHDYEELMESLMDDIQNERWADGAVSLVFGDYRISPAGGAGGRNFTPQATLIVGTTKLRLG